MQGFTRASSDPGSPVAVRGPKLTYANVVSTLCLFVILGGGAYAITLAPKNSVVSKSIRNGQVKGKDLANGSVSSTKVADGSLSGADVKDDSLTGADILESSLATVPSATNADHAANADAATSAASATSADHATNADHATSADSATHAANSDELGGSLPSAFLSAAKVRKIDTSNPDDCANASDPGCSPTVLSVGGGAFTLSYQCSEPTGPSMKLIAHAGGPNASVNWFYVHAGAPTNSLVSNGGQGSGDAQIFGPGLTTNGGTDHVDGQIVYRDDQRVVSVSFGATFGDAFYAFCGIQGTSVEADG